MATKAQVKEFINKIAPVAIAICNRKSRKILPSVCIAQACCESAYGTSKKMINANAIFGIKVGKSKAHFGTAWKEKAYSTKTNECYDGKTYTQITDLFRAYDTIEESIEDYFDMLGSCSRYTGAIGKTDARACITAIKNGGYATSPTYISTIMSIITSRDLTKYDACMTGSAPAQPTAPTAGGVATSYAVGKEYKLQNNMYVRTSAGGANKAYSALTANAKQHAYKNARGYGVLKKGTTVTCKEVKKIGAATWLRIPSGWVCAVDNSGTVYVR